MQHHVEKDRQPDARSSRDEVELKDTSEGYAGLDVAKPATFDSNVKNLQNINNQGARQSIMRSLQSRFGNNYAGRVARTFQNVQRSLVGRVQPAPQAANVIQRDWDWDGKDWQWKAPPDKPLTPKPTTPPSSPGTGLAPTGGTATATATAVVTPVTPTPVVIQYDTWPECYAGLEAAGKKGYDQFVTLNGVDKAQNIIENACKDKTSDKYDKAKADNIWSKRALPDVKFAQELDKKEKADVAVVTDRIKTLNHLCSETDGTNRPGSVGDGTSEWALYWEAEHGEPFRSPAGHSIKLSDYCKVIKSGLAEIQAKQGAVKDDPTKLAIAALLVRATKRYDSMKAALLVWNDRVALYPTKWGADGKSKVTPPGVEALANNKLVAGWPPTPTVPVA